VKKEVEMKTLRVAIVHDFAWKMRGAERCVEAICELFPKADLYMLFGDPSRLSSTIRERNIKFSYLNKLPFIKRLYRYTLPLWPSAIESFDLNKYDLVISSSSAVAKGVITSPETLHICYMHTPMRYLWDQRETYFSHANFSWAKRMLMKPFLMWLRVWDVAANQRIDKLIVNSSFSKRRVRKYYKRMADTIIYPPVEIEKCYAETAEVKLENNYYVAISPFEPNKGGKLIIECAKKLGLNVKILGEGSLSVKLKPLAKGFSNIEFLGWVAEDEKYRLLAGAKGLFFCGVEEFGIAAVEAMACGTPVLALKAGGALDFVQDGINGVFFEESNLDELTDAVRCLNNLWKEGSFNVNKIKNTVAKFSKVRFKKEFSEFVRECIRMRGDCEIS